MLLDPVTRREFGIVIVRDEAVSVFVFVFYQIVDAFVPSIFLRLALSLFVIVDIIVVRGRGWGSVVAISLF